MNIRERYSLRHYQPDDYPALAELINSANTALEIEHRITGEELAAYIEVPGFDARTDSFVLEDDGRIVAMSHQGFSTAGALCWADGVVHPGYCGQGIGAELLRLTEARCLEWAKSALAPGQTVSIRLAAAGSNARADRLFEAHGYQHTRTFYLMRIELNQPIDVPMLPEGFVLRPFDRERDAQAVYEAHMDAFSDHYDFERDRYEDWAQHLFEHPYRDLSLWQVAYAGDEIAGICINRAGGDNLSMAWVGILGVRKHWRKQGLGLALLKMSFDRFQEKGYQRAELMVDADNSTNAVALYERAGMHIHTQRLVYRKMLRRQVPEETL